MNALALHVRQRAREEPHRFVLVDSDSWAVWAAEGPLPVDAESWTLVLWLAQDRGLRWHSLVTDGGDALGSACQTVASDGRHGRDHWHIFHTFS